MDGATPDHFLVSLPYPYGPQLEHCDAAGTHVQVLWLDPITAAEAAYRRERGLEAPRSRRRRTRPAAELPGVIAVHGWLTTGMMGTYRTCR